MARRRHPTLLVVGAFFGSLASGACSSAGGAGTPQTHPTSTGPTEVRFDATGTLTLDPASDANLRLTAVGDTGPIALWLDGEVLDASLGEETVAPAPVSNVRLHAASSPTSFVLRAVASRGGGTAMLPVVVTTGGYAAARITTRYSGKRPDGTIVTSGFPNLHCADLATQPLVDGSPSAMGIPPVLLRDLPAQLPLAVTARVGHYESGCTDMMPLTAGMTIPIEVPLVDVPMALASTDLEVLFHIDANVDSTPLTTLVTDGRDRAIAAFPQKPQEGGELLDAMATALPPTGTARADFTAARATSKWDDAANAWLGAHTPSLHDRASVILDAAAGDVAGDPLVHLTAGTAAGTAAVSPLALGTLDATSGGVVATGAFGWTADPNDVVHLSGPLSFVPSALVVEAADERARQSGKPDVPTALAVAIDCDGFGAHLAKSGAAFVGCDAACAGALCRSGLGVLWDGARNASSTGKATTELALTASGNAVVGDAAEPERFDGTWVGHATAPGLAFDLKGTVSGDCCATPTVH